MLFESEMRKNREVPVWHFGLFTKIEMNNEVGVYAEKRAREREREREEKRVYKLRKGMQLVLDHLGLFFPSFPNEPHNTYKV